ncbi:MAG: family 16 glycosylhydrolase [Dysgonamonadaceae bacterium]|jgi:beta-glucanase (GH16 family)|nr:family 16 glycosylhydrolase [Dysgonamonadaceae bacterium]
MKKIVLIGIVSLFSLVSFAAADIVLDNFESGDKGWEPVNEGWVDFEIVNNPAPGGVNTSAKVMKIVRHTGTQNWAGIILRNKMELAFGTAANQYRYAHVKVLKTTNGTVAFKLENNGDAGSYTGSANYTPNNQWQEVVFDLGGANGTNYDDFFIMPDQAANPAQDITVYIDDIVFKPETNPVDPSDDELPGTYKLVWYDEFNGANGTGLDLTKWTYERGWGDWGWGNNEEEFYTDRTDNVFMRDGFLVIKAIREVNYNGSGHDYTSGRFITRNKGDWKYGRVEARFKLPKGRGTWPAFWMMPTKSVYGGWPNSGELDIMEFVGYEGDRIHGTVHRGAGSGGNGNGNQISIAGKAEDFHVIRIDWEPGYIKWYLNNQLFHTYTNAHAGSAQWPFDQQFYCILNFAVGGQWGGSQGVDTGIWPQEFIVDYVRVYQKSQDNAIDEINRKLFSVTAPSENEWAIASEVSSLQVTVYSLSGQKQLATTVSGSDRINVSALPAGVYIVSASDGTNVYSQKIIK